jgi:hypothetical protein
MTKRTDSDNRATNASNPSRRRFLAQTGGLTTTAGLSQFTGSYAAQSAEAYDSGRPAEESADPPRFGVNYVPSKNWWFTWKDQYWAPDSIQDDLNAIADINMDHIRIFPVWPWFQPSADEISGTMLDRLEQVFSMADNACLDVQVTPLQGHLSGYEWYPAWVGSRSYAANPSVTAAQKRLFTAIENRIGSHPRFMGFDLSNEINALYHHWDNELTDSAFADWIRELLTYCDTIAPDKTHVASTAGAFDTLSDTRQRLAARAGNLSIVHPWVFQGASDETGNLTFYGTHHQEYFTELIRAYQTNPDRGIWHHEIGAPLVGFNRETNIPKDKRAEWAERVVTNILNNHEHIYGITWWASHDIREKGPYNLPKRRKALEYTLGLLTIDNEPKLIANRLADLIEQYRQNPPSPVQSTAIIGTNEDEYLTALQEQEVTPKIVLEKHADDQNLLNKRGIETILNKDTETNT